MNRISRTASLVVATALLASVLTQSAVSAAPRTPEQIMHRATQVVVGGLHVCALMQDGTVWCWGNNEEMQLSTACIPSFNETTRCPPMPVIGLPGKVKKIFAEYFRTCAIMESDGSLMCWGMITSSAGNSPIAMDGVTNVIDYQNRCALTDTGDVWCWYTQCTLDESPILAAQDVVSWGNGDALCIITRDGSLKCTGDNMYGLLGNDKVQYSCSFLDVFNPFPYTTFAPVISQ